MELGLQHNELVEASNMITVFSYREIQLATNDFSQRLGDGVFGPVFRRKLEHGRPVAIKVLSRGSRQGSREFLNEVNDIAGTSFYLEFGIFKFKLNR